MAKKRKLTDEQMELFNKLNPLEMRLAMALLSGAKGHAAYKMANPGTKCNKTTASVEINRIKKRPQFIAFMNSVHAGMLSEAIMTREEALERLSSIGRSSLGAVIDVSEANFGTEDKPDMRVTWDISKELVDDPTLLDSVESIQQGMQGPKIKMYSAISAIQQISNMCGWQVPTKIDHTSVDGSMTPAPSNGLDVSKLSTATLHELVSMHYAAKPDGE